MDFVKRFFLDLFWINRIRRLANRHGARLYQLLLVQAWMMLYMYLFALGGTLVGVVAGGDFSGLFSIVGVAVAFPLLFRACAFLVMKVNGLPLD